MRGFALHQPRTIGEAVAILHELGSEARPLAGGTDLVAGIMRDTVVGKGMPYPGHLVDLSTVHGFTGIAVTDDGLRIGAGTTLAEIVESVEVRRRWPLLAAAAAAVASPEIRAVGTLGGNVNQRPRCWFFRGKDFDCLKKGGDVCFAVEGDNRFNAIVKGELCFIVHPSDTATALVALDARARIASPSGERIVPFAKYFIGPREDLLRETVLAPDEVMVEVLVPEPPTGARMAWQKVNEKNQPTWDFAVVSVAALVVEEGGVWRDGRIVLGGVAPVPYRATVVEEALAGRPIREAAPDAAARIRSVTRPMRHNGFKVALAQALVERVVLAAVA